MPACGPRPSRGYVAPTRGATARATAAVEVRGTGFGSPARAGATPCRAFTREVFVNGVNEGSSEIRSDGGRPSERQRTKESVGEACGWRVRLWCGTHLHRASRTLGSSKMSFGGVRAGRFAHQEHPSVERAQDASFTKNTVPRSAGTNSVAKRSHGNENAKPHRQSDDSPNSVRFL